jgi:hypothetical protein
MLMVDRLTNHVRPWRQLSPEPTNAPGTRISPVPSQLRAQANWSQKTAQNSARHLAPTAVEQTGELSSVFTLTATSIPRSSSASPSSYRTGIACWGVLTPP